MTDRPNLRLVDQTAWTDPEAYADLRETRHVKAPTLADDWRHVMSEIREHPVSHLLVAIAAIVSVAVLFVAPLILAGVVL